MSNIIDVECEDLGWSSSQIIDMTGEKKFRLCAKNLFLTYPQCGVDACLPDFRDFICNLGRSLDISK